MRTTPGTLAPKALLAAVFLAFGGAWLGNPGSVEHVPVGPSSDDLLMADHEVRNRLTGPGIQTKRPG
jgi:hypothetical protein